MLSWDSPQVIYRFNLACGNGFVSAVEPCLRLQDLKARRSGLRFQAFMYVELAQAGVII